MRLTLKLSLFLFVFFMQGEKSISLSDYQINQICRKEKRKSICVKILQEKRNNLKKGNLIEIPVIPYKKYWQIKFQIPIRKD